MLHTLYFPSSQPFGASEEEVVFIRRIERMRRAFRSHAPGTADVVNIALRLLMRIVVHDVIYVTDIDVTLGGICSY